LDRVYHPMTGRFFANCFAMTGIKLEELQTTGSVETLGCDVLQYQCSKNLKSSLRRNACWQFREFVRASSTSYASTKIQFNSKPESMVSNVARKNEICVARDIRHTDVTESPRHSILPFHLFDLSKPFHPLLIRQPLACSYDVGFYTDPRTEDAGVRHLDRLWAVGSEASAAVAAQIHQ
jgi:hypothetical protein